jgi:hypothetical protein
MKSGFSKQINNERLLNFFISYIDFICRLSLLFTNSSFLSRAPNTRIISPVLCDYVIISSVLIDFACYLALLLLLARSFEFVGDDHLGFEGIDPMDPYRYETLTLNFHFSTKNVIDYFVTY